jgi:hypothetical protein
MTDEKAFDGPRCALDWEFAGLVELFVIAAKAVIVLLLQQFGL